MNVLLCILALVVGSSVTLAQRTMLFGCCGSNNGIGGGGGGTNGYAMLWNTNASGNADSVTTVGKDSSGSALIVLAVAGFGSISVSDNKANTWTLAKSTNAAGGYVSAIYYASMPSTGSGHTFTVTDTGGGPVVAVAGFSHGSAPVLDKSAGNTNTASTTIAPGSVTPSVNGELLVTSVEYRISGASADASINSSYGIFGQNVNSVFAQTGGGGAFLIQSTAGASNPTWTKTDANGLGNGMISTIATFR